MSAMEEIPKFKSKKEFEESIFEGMEDEEVLKMLKSKPPETIVIGGKNLNEIEKSPAQEKIVNLSAKIIEEYIAKLDLGDITVDSSRILFVDLSDTGALGMHNPIYDLSLISTIAEAHLPVIIHETLHKISTDPFVQKDNKKQPKTEMIHRSGFHSVWCKNSSSSETTEVHGLFSVINEAVTEKISRELADLNKDKWQELEEDFSGKMSKSLERHTEKHNKKLGELQNSKVGGSEKEEMIQAEMNSFERLKEEINAMYSFQLMKNNPYKDPLSLLEQILEGLAYQELIRIKSFKHKEYEAAKEDAWINLQKAYLKNQTVQLRTLEQAFGEGTLRSLSSDLWFRSKKERERLRNDISRRLQLLKERAETV